VNLAYSITEQSTFCQTITENVNLNNNQAIAAQFAQSMTENVDVADS
jgi:hypothetical protein